MQQRTPSLGREGLAGQRHWLRRRGRTALGEAVEDLQAHGATVLAYLSAGTVEPGRPWFATAEDEGWLLDHWDDWDEWYAEVSEPGMRDLVVDEAGTELAKGFDGLFLDNTDMVQGHPDQREGMIDLVAAHDGSAEVVAAGVRVLVVPRSATSTSVLGTSTSASTGSLAVVATTTSAALALQRAEAEGRVGVFWRAGRNR